MAFVLLLDRKAYSGKDVHGWLTENGFVTWLAYDIPHVLEELSDFTVRNRPDCVLLEVPLLAESFDAMRSTLQTSSGSTEINVLGLANSDTKKKYFANNLDQLRTLIERANACSRAA